MSVAASPRYPSLKNPLSHRFGRSLIHGTNHLNLPISTSSRTTLRLDSFHPNSPPLVTVRRRVTVFVTAADEGVGDGVWQRLDFSKLLDAVLWLSEFLCISFSVVLSAGYLIAAITSESEKVAIKDKYVAGILLALAGAVAVGKWIQQRQWQRVCSGGRFGFPGGGGGGVNFNVVERIERLEDDVRNSTTVIRVLSRQLEKLGVRFRVTRKSMKEPLAETAALSQKNSEATRALAIQEDILGKELGEIQKVLLAMQEQQQKQLELILAIGKAGKLMESRRQSTSRETASARTCDTVLRKEDGEPLKIHTGIQHREIDDDKL
ncbi:hypothetical protein QJS10_CPA06g01992 [Acorus calamus]|uniref:Uncharacterized protein n=1 Tax=Acorus calamus TaxID=4465 RepID=A0AAV9ER23_ACOCL|nr:hypothetical protein QJS10_CPA06g01992 [Acorus calamus]